MAKLKLILDPSFLSENSGRYFEKIQLASDVESGFQPAKKIKSDSKSSNYDELTHRFGGIYSKINNFNETVILNGADEEEIQRGDSYRVSKELLGQITLASFRNFLYTNSVTDKYRQDLILFILLQNKKPSPQEPDRVALPFEIGSAIKGLLTDLTNMNAPLNAGDQKMVLEFCKHGEVKFHFTMPIESKNQYLESLSHPVGQASVSFTLSADNQFTMTPLVIEFQQSYDFPLQPLNEKLKNKETDFLKSFNMDSNAGQPRGSFAKEPWENTLLNQILEFLQKYRTECSFGGAAIFGMIGLILTVSGVFSPIGMIVTALSFVGMVAIDAGIYLTLTAVLGWIINKIATTAESIATYHIMPSKAEGLELTLANNLLQEIDQLQQEIIRLPLPANTQNSSGPKVQVDLAVSTFYSSPAEVQPTKNAADGFNPDTRVVPVFSLNPQDTN